jgi:hypothetical protein
MCTPADKTAAHDIIAGNPVIQLGSKKRDGRLRAAS